MPHVMRVLEYSILTIGDKQGAATFTEAHWQALLRYHDTGAGRRYYDLRHRGIRFKHYVGVLRTGSLTIELLPKADAVSGEPTDPTEDFDRWRRLLLRMLAEAGLLPVDSFNTALLHERENSLLDLYLALCLTEVETLLHRGLVKRYRQREGQVKALRGTRLCGQHLARNVVHQERFFTRYQPYDPDHLPHRLLRQALTLLPTFTSRAGLRGRAARALLAWPELPPVHPTTATFARLHYDRKTAPYRPALRIARLLLRRLSPDLNDGEQDFVALFFNMNHIWEAYLLRTLQRLAPPDWTVRKPAKVVFWQDQNGYQSQMRPDILLHHATHGSSILDAKWKRPHGQPAEADLRQLFAYAQHFGATQARLLYPQAADDDVSVDGAFTTKLFDLDAEELRAIQSGVPYLGVGGGAHAGDTDAAGYPRSSVAARVAQWLSVAPLRPL